MTLDEGKNFFLAMNGSGFMMAREDQMKYDSYLRLCITKETENLWRQELLENYYKEIISDNSDQEIGVIFYYMSGLTIDIGSIDSLSIMENTLIAIKSKLSNLDRVIIAEDINGRGYRSTRSGLIYLSYDLNDKAKARFFADTSLELLNINTDDEELLSRVKNGNILCKEILKELKI